VQVIRAFISLIICQTVEPPKIYTTVFHPEERLYTLLMIDPGQSVFNYKVTGTDTSNRFS
jgi:hypothetical protein